MTTPTTPERAMEIAAEHDSDTPTHAALISLAKQVYALTAVLVAAAEREACAKAADDQWVKNPNVSGGDAIRARSQQTGVTS